MPTKRAKIAAEKLEQVVGLLEREQIDLWITFVRETSLLQDPALPLICPLDVTWHSALLVARSGERLAIVGRYDVENIERLGVYTQVVGYDESIRPPLIAAIRRLEPTTIALNFSEADPAADGLTHGMYTLLLGLLAEAGYADRVLSAETLLASLRGRKSATELDLIRRAIASTERIYREVGAHLTIGQTERELADFLHDRLAALGLETAWDREYCPLVNTGPDTVIGHAGPGALRTQRGHLVHFDFGVQQDGFCSDLQRMWYILAESESEPPAAVRRAWAAVRGALLAGAAALQPGAQGWEVDAAARTYLVQQRYPDYKHAFGHHIGRSAHDGATTLGPRWERYGQTPYGVIEADNCFAIELGVFVEGHGYIYLEENVRVTEGGVEWLSDPQTELWLVT